MIGVLVNGCRGKLGQAICNFAGNGLYKDKVFICAGVDIAGSRIDGVDVERDKAFSDPFSPSTFPLFTDISYCDMPADVIIDCSTAKVTPAVIKYAVEKNTPLVICTTGLSDETDADIDDAAKVIPVFRSANMSIGVNLVADLVEQTARALGKSFDIEVIEKHHNLKADSPSGTAITLAEAAKRGRAEKLELIYGRGKQSFKRRGSDEIGIHAIRGGTIVGEHAVLFAGTDEVIEIKHTTYSKDAFAEGAVRAAIFLKDLLPGLYDMQDLVSHT